MTHNQNRVCAVCVGWVREGESYVQEQSKLALNRIYKIKKKTISNSSISEVHLMHYTDNERSIVFNQKI